MYTCADDVLCCGVFTLTCILKEGARRSKRRAAITPETRSQTLTAIERILEWGTIHVPSQAVPMHEPQSPRTSGSLESRIQRVPASHPALGVCVG